MRMTLLLAGAAVAALSLSACNKPADQNPPSATNAAENAAVPDAHPAATLLTPSDETKAPTFVAKAASSDMFEIQSSKLALDRSHDPAVLKFARTMIAAHTKTTAALKAAIAASGLSLSPPPTLPDDLQHKLDDLAKASPTDFDAKYMADQVDGHQTALDVMQKYAQDGDTAQIKDFAAHTAPTVQEHLSMAKGIRDGLKPGNTPPAS